MRSERDGLGLTWERLVQSDQQADPDAYELESMVEQFRDLPLTRPAPFHGYCHLKNAAAAC